MNIAIRADGGQTIGMGHLVRCSAIAHGCLRKGYRVRFFSRGESLSFLSANRFDAQALPVCEDIEEETRAFIGDAKKWGAEYAILDSYDLTPWCYREISKAFPSIVIDDNARLPYTASVLLNYNFYAPGLNYSNCDVNTLLLGGNYALLREEFRLTPTRFSERVRRVLVTMGGSDINGFTPVVLEALSNFRNITVVVVVGSMFCNHEAIDVAAKKCVGKVETVASPDNIASVFSSCDMAVSAGGSTVYELSALGIPSILIEQAQNQRLICQFCAENGIAKVLGRHSDTTPQMIETVAVALMRDTGLRREMHEKAMALVSRSGVDNFLRDAVSPGEKQPQHR